MSVILKCDRCGKPYEYEDLSFPSGIIFERRDFNVNPKTYSPFLKTRMDLCPDCLKKIQEFLGELNNDADEEVILEGTVLQTGVKYTDRVFFYKKCNIAFLNPVPVMFNFGQDVLGHADISYKGKDLFGRFYVKKKLLGNIYDLDDVDGKIYVAGSFSNIKEEICSIFTLDPLEDDRVNAIMSANLESVSILLKPGDNVNHFVKIVK